MGTISKAFEEKPARMKEVLGEFHLFLDKAMEPLDIHWEIYDDHGARERVMSITALAKDGHLLKHEIRRRVEPVKELDDLYRQIDAIDRGLLKELCRLEGKHRVKTTKGRWY